MASILREMRHVSPFLAATLLLAADPLMAQARRPASRRPSPAPVTKKAPAEMKCPSVLGVGVSSRQTFCDVLTGREPGDGIIVSIPPHRGTATLTFTLHNRHTYSEQEVRSNRAYARYTATIGVLTMNNNLIERAVVQSEFRTAADLLDRIEGGAGPGGVKAVAPTGSEPITMTMPADVDQVSILGEKLSLDRLDGNSTYSAPGRPIAVVSGVQIEYRPAPETRKKK